jgi:hypothetical protein
MSTIRVAWPLAEAVLPSAVPPAINPASAMNSRRASLGCANSIDLPPRPLVADVGFYV